MADRFLQMTVQIPEGIDPVAVAIEVLDDYVRLLRREIMDPLASAAPHIATNARGLIFWQLDAGGEAALSYMLHKAPVAAEPVAYDALTNTGHFAVDHRTKVIDPMSLPIFA